MPPKKRKLAEIKQVVARQTKRLKFAGAYLQVAFEKYWGDNTISWENWKTLDSIRSSKIFDVVWENSPDLPPETRTILANKVPEYFADCQLAYYILNMAIYFIGCQDRKATDKARDNYFRKIGLLNDQGKIILVNTSGVAPSTWSELITSCMLIPSPGVVTTHVDVFFGNKFVIGEEISMNELPPGVRNEPRKRYGYMKLKLGLYSSHLSTYKMMPVDFWTATKFPYFHHYYYLCEQYVVKNDKYTYGYVRNMNQDQHRINPLVLQRYYDTVPYAEGIMITFTDVVQLVATNFRSLVSENQNTFPSNMIDVRLESLSNQSNDELLSYMRQQINATQNSNTSFMNNVINTPDEAPVIELLPFRRRAPTQPTPTPTPSPVSPVEDPYHARLRYLRWQRLQNHGEPEEEDDDDDEDVDSEDDVNVVWNDDLPGHLEPIVNTVKRFFPDKPLGKDARSHYIDDMADSIDSADASSDPSSEEYISTGNSHVDKVLGDLVSNGSVNAVHGSNQAVNNSGSNIISISSTLSSPSPPKVVEDGVAQHNNGAPISRITIVPSIAGDGRSHTSMVNRPSIANNNNNFVISESGTRRWIDESNGTGRPQNTSIPRRKPIQKGTFKSPLPKVTTSRGRMVDGQPIGQINNMLETNEDTAQYEEAVQMEQEDDPEVSGNHISDDPMAAADEIGADIVRSDVNPAEPPIPMNLRSQRAVHSTPGSSEVIVRSPIPHVSSNGSVSDRSEIIDVSPVPMNVIRNSRAVNNYMRNIVNPTGNQSPDIIDNLIIDQPDPQPMFVESESSASSDSSESSYVSSASGINAEVLNANLDAGVGIHQQLGRNAIARARRRADHRNYRFYTPKRFTRGKRGWITSVFTSTWYQRLNVNPEASKIVEARRTSNFIDNVFYGFIPSMGIVNANFMQVEWLSKKDYYAGGPDYFVTSKRYSKELMLTKIEYRIEWKLTYGDVGTVRMIIGYFDGNPLGQFYNVIDQITEDMIGYYGFNIDVGNLTTDQILENSPIYYLGNIQDLDVPDLFKTPTSVSPIKFDVQMGASPIKIILDKKYDLNVQAINYDVEILDTNATYRKSDCGNVDISANKFTCHYPKNDSSTPDLGNIFVCMVGDYNGGEIQANMYTRVHYYNL
jgi:hypothetical protein